MAKHTSLIGGEWTDFGNYQANVNPANTDDIIGEYSYADADGVDQAVAAAAAAAKSAWANSNPQTRHDLLAAIGTKLAERADEIGTLLAREEGKTLGEAKGGDHARVAGVQVFLQAKHCDLQASFMLRCETILMSRSPVSRWE